MGMMRLSSGDKPAEKSKPSNDSCAILHKGIADIRTAVGKLKSVAPIDSVLQELQASVFAICSELTIISKKLRTPDSRELRDLGMVIYNQINSLVDIIDEDEYDKDVCTEFKDSLTLALDNLTESFLETYNIDLLVSIKKVKVADPVEDEVQESIAPTKKKRIKSGKTIAKVTSLSDLSKVVPMLHGIEEPEPAIIEKSSVVVSKGNVKKTLDFSDQDALTVGKYKNYSKQFYFEDERETGVCLMPNIPIMAVSKPPVDPVRLQRIEGLVMDSLCGYAVFTRQLVASLQLSATDSIKSAKDPKVIAYVLSMAKQEYGITFDLVGEPCWMNYMLCFWLMPHDQHQKIRQIYSRFAAESWRPAFMSKE